jgi:hypothetical protein
VAPCRYCELTFGGTYRLHLQGRRKIRQRGTSVSRCLQTLAPRSRTVSSSLKTEAIFLRTVSLDIYTAPHPRRRHSSCTAMYFGSRCNFCWGQFL